jgi:hypothetical protein
MDVPPACHRFEAVDNRLDILGMKTSQCPPLEQALDRLGPIQPTAPQRRVNRPNTVLKTPDQPSRGLVSSQIIQHQPHPQRRHVRTQACLDG